MCFLRETLVLLYHIHMFRYITKIGHLYNTHIRGHKEEPRFLILGSFAITFILVPQFGSGLFRVSSILYGAGAALTLDEFSLWLRFNPDAYWGPQGRISI